MVVVAILSVDLVVDCIIFWSLVWYKRHIEQRWHGPYLATLYILGALLGWKSFKACFHCSSLKIVIEAELYKVQKVQFKFSSRHWTQQSIQVQFIGQKLNLNWPLSSRKKLNWIENFNSVLNCYTALPVLFQASSVANNIFKLRIQC